MYFAKAKLAPSTLNALRLNLLDSSFTQSLSILIFFANENFNRWFEKTQSSKNCVSKSVILSNHLKSSLGAGGPPAEWADSLAVWCGSGEPGDDNNDNNENYEAINDKHKGSLH